MHLHAIISNNCTIDLRSQEPSVFTRNRMQLRQINSRNNTVTRMETHKGWQLRNQYSTTNTHTDSKLPISLFNFKTMLIWVRSTNSATFYCNEANPPYSKAYTHISAREVDDLNSWCPCKAETFHFSHTISQYFNWFSFHDVAIMLIYGHLKHY
jgi:hypothetical protein